MRVAFTADGRWAYVSGEIGRQVSKLDVSTNTLVRTVKLPMAEAKPMGVEVSRDQTLRLCLDRARRRRGGIGC